MAKVLLWVIVILAVILVMRVVAAQKIRQNQQTRTPQQSRTQTKRGKAEPMVRCEHCGVHLPRSQALMSDGHTWCSLEHAKHGPRK